MTITFCLVPFIPLAVRRECSGFKLVPYSILKCEKKLSDLKHYNTNCVIPPQIIFANLQRFPQKLRFPKNVDL